MLMLRSALNLALVLSLSLHAGSCPPRAAPGRAAGEAPAPAQAPGSSAPKSAVRAGDPHAHPEGGGDSERARVPAPTMSYLGADWLTRPERIEEEQPEKMLDALGIRPGMAVADIGAGVGYHALRMAGRVGPTGRVYATDIQEEMLVMLRKNLREQGISNVVPVLSRETDTGLPPRSVDLVLMVDVYHELGEPERFLSALKGALRPGARVVLVEFRGEDPDVPIKEEHKMTAAQATSELARSGFRLVERHEFLPWQHILVFSLTSPSPSPSP